MHLKNIQPWQHDHVFGHDQKLTGERKTVIVTILTSLMMAVEIVAGILFGSMALLADGLHMASHATALGVASFAYWYARRHSHDRSFSFGTGKVNTLGGFMGAVLLGFFALFMAAESVKRIILPVEIVFNQAILVAVLGLAVNGISVFILDVKKDHDHNLRSAYLHVLADALTSLLAIFALLAAKYLGLIWMDPLVGIVGAVLVWRWAWGLLRATSYILLDKNGPGDIQKKIKECIEKDGDSRVTDLHLWPVGNNIYGAIISVVAHNPLEPKQYKSLVPPNLGLVHITVEVCRCCD